MNKIPKHWQKSKFEDVLQYEQPSKYIVKSTEYGDDYKTPVLTAGKSFILGYTDEKDGIFTDVPVIIFDDFTTDTKFVDFHFKVKSSAMKILKPTHNTNIKFIFYLMQTIHHKSDTHKRYWISEYAKREIPLPPLDEQNLIVKKIESCFEKIDLAISNFKKSKELIEIYKQSVLSHAFNGKLTNSNLNSWQVKKLCDTSDIITGSTPPKNEPKFYGNEYPFFKPTDLNDGYLVKFARDNLSEAGKQISRQLPPKSVLVTCIGATIGKTGLIRVEGSCNQQINAIVPKENLLPEYVYFYVISAQFQNLILENASSTTLPILNKSKFEALPILLPPLSEQNLIAAQIEKRFKAADSALNLIEQNLKKAEILKQSILSKAFNGRLVKDKK